MLFDKKIAVNRAEMMDKIRTFFERESFLEVETPLMAPTVDLNPNLTPFEIKLADPSGRAYPMYLHPSPEFSMKKLIGAGFGNIYTLCKVFRNGEVGGGRHNPEFTMLEWYRQDADYRNIMDDTEALIRFVAGADTINYQGRTIDLAEPWPRKSVHELFIEYAGIDLLQNKDYPTLAKTAQDKRLKTSACKTWDDIFYLIFLNEIEPKLGLDRPVFVYDYPATQSALALVKKDDPFWCERFEFYMGGQELCNAFSELLDAEEQKKRFEAEREERRRMGKTAFEIDEKLLTSLNLTKHPYGGNALGVDRLLMVLMDATKIEDVLLFPVSKMINP
ncbi:EF-P lysine aminoacylase GenX [Candidatus Peregrinibacteria bacterium]|nr:EF-P lysine aminoacylase GenX [Candidatus Peregrinibacteria bacterium]